MALDLAFSTSPVVEVLGDSVDARVSMSMAGVQYSVGSSFEAILLRSMKTVDEEEVGGNMLNVSRQEPLWKCLCGAIVVGRWRARRVGFAWKGPSSVQVLWRHNTS